MRAIVACGTESLEAAPLAVSDESGANGKAAGKFAARGSGTAFEVSDGAALIFANGNGVDPVIAASRGVERTLSATGLSLEWAASCDRSSTAIGAIIDCCRCWCVSARSCAELMADDAE